MKKKILKDKETPPLITLVRPNSSISEQFRTLRTNIQFSMIDEEYHTISITSSTPNAGKSTISSNLAVTFASQGKKVLYVDADLRKPTVHKIFNVRNHEGLTTLLTNKEYKIEDYVIETTVGGLDILPSGAIPPNPAELLSSNRMMALIEEMKQQYDLVIFDTPPVLAVTDAQIMATKVDGTLFVLRKGFVKKEQALRAKELLSKVNANIIGAVINRSSKNEENYYYYYNDKN